MLTGSDIIVIYYSSQTVLDEQGIRRPLIVTREGHFAVNENPPMFQSGQQPPIWQPEEPLPPYADGNVEFVPP